MDIYTDTLAVKMHQDELLRQAEQHRLAQEVQAEQILSRWVLSLLRRSISKPSQPTPARPSADYCMLVKDGG